MRFLSNLVASTLGALIALGIIFFFGFAFLIAVSLSSDTKPRVRANSVLKMQLSGAIPEMPTEDAFAAALGRAPAVSVLEILDAIKSASTDENIKGLWLEPISVGATWPNMQEIRKALIEFKSSGKPFYASSGTNGFSEKDYYLASIADSVFSPPESYFELNGFYLAGEFYQEALAKFDVTPEVVRSGKFKGAVEPYLRKDFSPENELQLTALVENTERIFLDGISESRNISKARLEELSDGEGIYTSMDAKNAGLVDALWYERQIEDLFAERVFGDKDPRWTNLSTYAMSLTGHEYLAEGGVDEVAVVYASGNINTGKSGANPNPLTGGGQTLGSETFIKTMNSVREDDEVKAVVIRIDSPGGSATASDEMWDAVIQTKKVKPVIVSMGSLAASGGYYIAAPADYIVASPSTITGSIGVFAMFLNPVDFFKNKLGVHFDVVKTGPYADMFGMTRKLSDRDKEIIGRSVDQTYASFIGKVAEGRGLSVERVDEIAQGRVWSGVDALGVGLVDSLGDLSDAVDIAANRAGLDESGYSVALFPKPVPFMEQLSDAFSVKAAKELFARELTDQERLMLDYKAQLTELFEQNGQVRASLPFRISIQ